MRISKIAARNAKGFENFELVCGDVNLITGQNGVGKSSVLDIVCAAFSSDGDRALLKTGTEEGEIVVTFVDEQTGETFELRRRLKPGEVSQPTIKSSKAGKIGAPRTWLKGIIDSISLDPLRRAMTASPKEQAQILLETIPLSVTAEEVQGAISCVGMILGRDPASHNALDEIEAVRVSIYDRRTGVKRVAEDKRRAIRELENTLPADDGADYATVLSELRKRQGATIAKIASIEGRAESLLAVDKESIQDAHITRKDKLESDAQAEIEAIRNLLAMALDDLSVEKAQLIEIVTTRVSNTSNVESEHLHQIANTLSERIGKAEEQVKSADRAAMQRRIIGEARTDAEAGEQEAGVLTQALKNLEALKASLLEKLPIKGVKIEGGQAFLNGVPLEEVNLAERAKFWIRVGVQRAIDKDLGVVVIDDAEHFDDVNFPLLVKAAKQSGLQFFISKKVDGQPFKVETL